MSNNKKFIYIFLGIIFFTAVLFRFINLSSHPAGFHIDEASLGYNGYSLLLTGKDDNGNLWPLYIDMFGDNRPSGYHYLTIVPIMFFGLTEFAVRFPGALVGSVTVFSMFFLANVLFKNKTISLLSALLTAVSPWHIALSRASSEAIIALFFIILGFSLLLHGFAENKKKLIVWGAIFASISYFFYHTPRVFVPLIFASLSTFLYPLWKSERKFLLIKTLAVFIFLSSMTLCLVFLLRGGTGRYSQVNIFNNFETNFLLLQELQEDVWGQSPKYASRLVHNKITNNFLVSIDNYFDYFSGDFLFVKGGLPIWYNTPRMGLMHIVELPFLLFGLYWLLRSNNKMYKVPIIWLFLAPVVSAITMDDIPNINRAIAMVPVLEIIVAVGFVNLAKVFYKRRILFVGVCMALFLGNIIYFGHQYFVNAKVHNPWYRNNGFSEMMSIVNKNYGKYDTIVMSKFQGGIYPLVLFYSKYNPKTYQGEGSTKNMDYNGFGKFFFVPQDCPSVQRNDKFPKVHALFVDKGDCPLDKSLKTKKIEYVYRGDRTKVFRIVYD